jgi:hypothetical protein
VNIQTNNTTEMYKVYVKSTAFKFDLWALLCETKTKEEAQEIARQYSTAKVTKRYMN